MKYILYAGVYMLIAAIGESYRIFRRDNLRDDEAICMIHNKRLHTFRTI